MKFLNLAILSSLFGAIQAAPQIKAPGTPYDGKGLSTNSELKDGNVQTGSIIGVGLANEIYYAGDSGPYYIQFTGGATLNFVGDDRHAAAGGRPVSYSQGLFEYDGNNIGWGKNYNFSIDSQGILYSGSGKGTDVKLVFG